MSGSEESFTITIVDHKAFSASKEKVLLESIEQQNIDIQSHCREGFCGACRTKLRCGKVDYTLDPLAFIDDDEILPCCCVPDSDLVLEISQ